jgi:phosphocarrier protein FPr
MFPMVAELEEFRAAKAAVAKEMERLGILPAQVSIGVMIEVPSAAIIADSLAKEADFFSIGTNDLTQYTLAMDRGHPKLAPQVDGLSPAVLHLISETVKGAHTAGKWVGVCGGIASDPHGVPILLGLGVNELSISLPAIPAIKGQIRKLNFEKCRELAEKALAAESAADVRALVREPNES